MTTYFKTYLPYFFIAIVAAFACFATPVTAAAATLSIAPGTGVYKTGQTFTVNLLVNTGGVPVNAADGTISYNPRELSAVAVSHSNSIFNLWTAEPAFSNAAGTVSFSGGVPTGYTGASGVVMSVTFRSLTSGTARVSISQGSVLAADGRGTNVLAGMNGGTYTLAAVESQPAPEVIVEYVPPANTPGAPKVVSTTHADTTLWYPTTEAVLSWSLPSDVTAVRTSLDSAAMSVPTKVYDTPIKAITLKDLSEGVSYFHLQLKNKDGWGKVTHYRLAIDSEKPKAFTISLPDGADLSNPVQTLRFVTEDATSHISRYKVQIDGGEAFEVNATNTALVPLPSLTPGEHNVVAEAFDGAGNSLLASFAFTISAFDKPVIVEYPQKLSAGVIPVIKGTTRPKSLVQMTVLTPMGVSMVATTTSDDSGQFIFIPEAALSVGVYSLTAVAIDQFGAQSAPSDTVKIVVEEPGYIVIGSFIVNVLSVLIPLLGLCVLGWVLIVYSVHRLQLLRKRIRRESDEATAMAKHEFAAIREIIAQHEARLTTARKSKKLTEAEAALIADIKAVVDTAETRVEKEVADVAALVANQ